MKLELGAPAERGRGWPLAETGAAIVVAAAAAGTPPFPRVAGRLRRSRRAGPDPAAPEVAAAPLALLVVVEDAVSSFVARLLLALACGHGSEEGGDKNKERRFG